MMVEAGANQVSEEIMVKALELAQNTIQSVIGVQKELVEKVGVTPMQYELVLPAEEVKAEVNAFLEGKLGANLISAKNEERILTVIISHLKLH
jgi:polyribonucleotide nucleotidyltransferase